MRLILFSALLLSQSLWAASIADSVMDPALRRCINTLAEENGWHTPSDVIAINCHAQNIQSLTGLDVFINLEKLSLFNNALEQAAIPAFGKLKSLNLARNKLKAIQLGELPALTELLLFNNALASLTLPSLPALKQFKANANAMHQFHYTHLPQIEKIYLFDNKLVTIDIDRLPALRYMDVRQNPMPDELYQRMDNMKSATILHDGNAPDWK